MAKGWIQDPDSTLDYTFDWSEWLEEDDDVIVSNSITITPSNHTSNLTLENTTYDDTRVTVWLKGGRKNTKYKVSCEITTDQGRVETASIYIAILNK